MQQRAQQGQQQPGAPSICPPRGQSSIGCFWPPPFLLASWCCAWGTAPGTPRQEGDGCLLPLQPSTRVPTGGTAASTSASALVGLTRAAAARVTTSTRTRGPAPVRVHLPPLLLFPFLLCLLLAHPPLVLQYVIPSLANIPCPCLCWKQGLGVSPALLCCHKQGPGPAPRRSGTCRAPCQPPPAFFSPQ